MTDNTYPLSTRELAQKRRQLAPGSRSGVPRLQSEGLRGRSAVGENEADHRRSPSPMSRNVTIASRAIPRQRLGTARPNKIWVAAEMRAGAYAHSALALNDAQ
jgi:hypothetical protein